MKLIEIKNIGTKSINMSEIKVYLAMFSTTIDKILYFLVLIRWKWVIILNFSQLKLGTFLIFYDPLFGPFPKFPAFYFGKLPLVNNIFFNHLILHGKDNIHIYVVHDSCWTVLNNAIYIACILTPTYSSASFFPSHHVFL